MLVVNSRIQIPPNELAFEYACSGGPGGQNVNKVSSKAILRWKPGESPSLPPAVRQRFLLAYASRMTNTGEVLITSQRTRDQSRNASDCLEKLKAMILAVAVPPKPRRPTKPTKASIARRIASKSHRSDLKRGRREPGGD